MATGTLTGQTIANTYKALLKITGTTAGGETLHATTQKVIEDGDGNPFPFSAAQDAILMTGTSRLEFNDNGEYISGDGTDLTITSGRHVVFALGSAGSVYHTGDGGSNNAIYGLNAGVALASGGNQNVLLGEGAGSGLTIGDNNVAIGYNALDAAVSDETSNVAIGANSMGAADQGSHETADVDQNVCIGVNAGLGGDFGSSDLNFTDNVAIGYSAMDGTGALGGFANIFLGTDSGGGSWVTASSNYNVGIGYQTLPAALNAAEGNIAIGYRAAYSMQSGDNNTIIGYAAGTTTLDVDKVVIIGQGAGAGTMTSDADGSVAIGATALSSLTTGAQNVAIGLNAADSLVQGGYNIAIGADALGADTRGSRNVAIGRRTLLAQNFTDASTASNNDSYNVAIGFEAGNDVSTGKYNTLIGGESGDALTTGYSNTVMGYNSLGSLQTGFQNTVLGVSAMGDTSTAVDNCVAIGFEAGKGVNHANSDGLVAVGYQAGLVADAATASVFVGYQSGLNTTSGGHNTCLGFMSGRGITDASFNTAIGREALSEGNCTRNAAVGYEALKKSTGSNNTALGMQTGALVEGGQENTLIGAQAGNALVSGNNCTLIGYNADVDNSARSDSISIGKDLETYSANSYARIGNNSNYVQLNFSTSGQNWVATSDERIKQNIEDGDLGLEFVNKLRPIKYEDKPSAEWDDELKSKIKDGNLKTESDGVRKDGFIAQEVKKVADDLGTTFSGWQGHPTDTSEKQMLGYDMFVVPLVKAVQELSARVKALEDA